MSKLLPMFPLTILPLPGELVPLHIFEPRYRELLHDAETDDISFGVYFNHAINTERIGALVKLEHVIHKHPEGESDVIVKCYDMFTMQKMYRSYKSKLYAGGDVEVWNTSRELPASEKLENLFGLYLDKLNNTRHAHIVNPYAMAAELNLELTERYDFLTADAKNRESFLTQRIKYQLHLIDHQERSKDVFHLN
jgi:uncharacterized protein